MSTIFASQFKIKSICKNAIFQFQSFNSRFSSFSFQLCRKCCLFQRCRVIVEILNIQKYIHSLKNSIVLYSHWFRNPVWFQLFQFATISDAILGWADFYWSRAGVANPWHTMRQFFKTQAQMRYKTYIFPSICVNRLLFTDISSIFN